METSNLSIQNSFKEDCVKQISISIILEEIP